MSFTDLPDAEAVPGRVGNGRSRAALHLVDEVVSGGVRRGRGVPPGAVDLRRRLLSLQRAADGELRRRGVVQLPRPPRVAMPGQTVRDAFANLPGFPNLLRMPDRQRLQQELPMQLMGALGQLAITLRERTGRDVIDLESLQDLMSVAFRAVELRRNHNQGRYTLDGFGFDPEYTDVLMPLAKLVYRKYWRVDTTGVRNVPRRGSALLVSNHAGVLPYDGAMIKVALFEEGVDRHARALIADWFFGMPGLSWLLRRTGQTLGHPDDTHRLLTSGELVLVFPEGIKGTGKLWSERYRLRRFGRGGFVEAAIRAQAPIVPISVVGSEELYPMFADIRPLAQLTGFPYFPLTPTWPWLGPLGLVPLPSKWRIEFHPPVRTDELPVEAADDPSVVMRVADEVREIIQAGVVSNLMQRRGVFRG
ncbi:MAG TPA: lysophospholipid acyltransferase family protein [Candidatus Dormibacteraeota bacterium]|jgi:1-acyl-sn-glycerol-3-phosphate acyltransferase|nr:lysophospholipid acyltransferase family protein [Candidatus Dormibacteraeota bacterium]